MVDNKLLIETVADIVKNAIFILGGLFLLSCLIDVIRLIGTKRVVGSVTDCVQEYTNRGFLWKTKVSYEYDGKERFYVLRARAFRRGSGDVNLRVTKRGRVVEIGHMVEKLIFGIVAIVVAIALKQTLGL